MMDPSRDMYLKTLWISLTVVFISSNANAFNSNDIIDITEKMRGENDCHYNFIFLIDKSNGTSKAKNKFIVFIVFRIQ